MSDFDFDPTPVIFFRRELHTHPEAAGRESETASRIRQWLDGCLPDIRIDGIGGYGIAAVFEGRTQGPTLLFRCDMDAVPVEETTGLPYASRVSGLSHSCGHDGHMAILCGVAMYLRDHPPVAGRVVLLFQPSEETGEGALRVLEDPRFDSVVPDVAIALHNLPHFPEGRVCLRKGTFCCASAGLAIVLRGTASHAAYPEHGLRPEAAFARLLTCLPDLTDSEGGKRVTITHGMLGTPGFGTAPEQALIQVTLRAGTDRDLADLMASARHMVKETAQSYGLSYGITESDRFPATVNNDELVASVTKICQDLTLEVVSLPEPMRWSEDFGYFCDRFSGLMFGLGAGDKCPQLHHGDYDFPDDLIATGVRLFAGISRDLLS